MENAIGNAVSFNTRYHYQDILSRFNWNSYIKLSLQTLGKLEFWKINLRSINGKEIKTSKELSELKIFRDASDSGFGA